MGKYQIVLKPIAEKHLSKHKKAGNKIVQEKIKKMMIELSIHPFEGIGNPEALKSNLTGFWSRRINQKDRLIYKVEEDIVTVYVVSAMGHYDEK